MFFFLLSFMIRDNRPKSSLMLTASIAPAAANGSASEYACSIVVQSAPKTFFPFINTFLANTITAYEMLSPNTALDTASAIDAAADGITSDRPSLYPRRTDAVQQKVTAGEIHTIANALCGEQAMYSANGFEKTVIMILPAMPIIVNIIKAYFLTTSACCLLSAAAH